MSLSKTLYLSAPYQTAYSITTDNSDLEKLLRMRYGRYLTAESEDGRQYRSVVISKYRRAFNMQCGEKLYRTRVPLRAFDSYMLKTVEFDDKVIAFHASAVECGGKAYVFLARSGAGKTTLCAYLTAHGFGYITEDCVLIDRETLRVYPYTAPLRLRPGGITALEAAGVCLPPLKRMLEGELFRYIYEPDNPVEKPLELGGIYFILRTLNMNAAIDMTGTTKMHQLMLSPMIPYPVDGEFLRLMTKIGSVPCRNLVYKDMNYAAEVLENA